MMSEHCRCCSSEAPWLEGYDYKRVFHVMSRYLHIQWALQCFPCLFQSATPTKAVLSRNNIAGCLGHRAWKSPLLDKAFAGKILHHSCSKSLQLWGSMGVGRDVRKFWCWWVIPDQLWMDLICVRTRIMTVGDGYCATDYREPLIRR